MKIISPNKKLKVLKLYYEGMPATAICKEYRIPHSTLYKWIADYPKQSVMNAELRKHPISLSKTLSHNKKLEDEIAFLRRTVVKDIPLKERMAIIDREYPKSLRELKKYTDEYIQKYNQERPHEHLKFISPDEFERKLLL